MEPYIPEMFFPEVKKEDIEEDALSPTMFPDCTLGPQNEKDDDLILDDMKEEDDIKIEEEDVPPADPLMMLSQQGPSSEDSTRTKGENNTRKFLAGNRKAVVDVNMAREMTSNSGDMTYGSDNIEDYAVNEKFKNDHDQFTQELRKVPNTRGVNPVSPNEDYLTIWPWFKIVHFLNDYIDENISDIEVTSSDQYDDQHKSIESVPVHPPTPSDRQNIPSKIHYVNGNCTKKRSESKLLSDLIAIEKQKLEFLKKQVEDENDSERMFLLSLLSSMKTLNPRRAHLFRIKVQQLLYEAQFSKEFCSSLPDVVQHLPF